MFEAWNWELLNGVEDFIQKNRERLCKLWEILLLKRRMEVLVRAAENEKNCGLHSLIKKSLKIDLSSLEPIQWKDWLTGFVEIFKLEEFLAQLWKKWEMKSLYILHHFQCFCRNQSKPSGLDKLNSLTFSRREKILNSLTIDLFALQLISFRVR